MNKEKLLKKYEDCKLCVEGLVDYIKSLTETQIDELFTLYWDREKKLNRILNEKS